MIDLDDLEELFDDLSIDGPTKQPAQLTSRRGIATATQAIAPRAAQCTGKNGAQKTGKMGRQLSVSKN